MYEVPLLYVTQKLALKRYLHQEQTLTSIHDKYEAWLSLGATGATVWKYKNLLKWKERPEVRKKDLVTFGGIVCVLLYLSGGLLLGIIAPDLITLGDVVGNTTDFQKLTSYISNIGQDHNQYVSVTLCLLVTPTYAMVQARRSVSYSRYHPNTLGRR